MMKNKKKLLIITSAAVVALSACAGKSPSETTVQETTAQETTVQETGTAVDKVTAAIPSETPSGENTVSGTVTGGTEHSINITTEDGTELEFYIGDDTVEDYEDGYLIDRKVLITYTGQIDGTDTDSAKVLKVSDFK